MTRRTQRSANEALDQVQLLIKIKGVRAAAEALIAICENTNAPANARATAGSALFRAGGLFARQIEDLDDVPLEEMTAEQMAREIAQLQAKRVELAKIIEEEEAAEADAASKPFE